MTCVQRRIENTPYRVRIARPTLQRSGITLANEPSPQLRISLLPRTLTELLEQRELGLA
jgi:hypothetical protein